MPHANKPVGRVSKVQTEQKCDAICQLRFQRCTGKYIYSIYTAQYFTLLNQMLYKGCFMAALFAKETARLQYIYILICHLIFAVAAA